MPEAGLLAWDKFQHAAAFGLLTLLGFYAFVRLSSFKHRLICAAAVSVLFGALVEVAQALFTTARVAEAGDVVADIVGAVAACAVTVCVMYRHKS